jgi:dinuclear metal center YbgI/SA1388 family protein
MTISLVQAVELLESIAPTRYAAEWDNVGLLVEPRPDQAVTRALLTIDLTAAVLKEAAAAGADLIVSYHPPIFDGLKRLTFADCPVVMAALDQRIAVYSPHTALDAVPDGVNDWLAEALGPGDAAPISPHSESEPHAGMGRKVRLSAPAGLAEVVARIKRHLGLKRLRVAAAARHRDGELIQTAAVCAGAGGSLLAPLSGFDLYLTGEMRHHDSLAKLAQGSSVVLCDHSNTERGYLPRLAERLRSAAAFEVLVSQRDRDPLDIV